MITVTVTVTVCGLTCKIAGHHWKALDSAIISRAIVDQWRHWAGRARFKPPCHHVHASTNHLNKTRYNLHSGWLPTRDHGPGEKMVHSRWLAAPVLVASTSLRRKSRLVPPSLKSSRTGPLCFHPQSTCYADWTQN